MMDITHLFKAGVKTVRTRNKALGTNVKPDDPNRIFPRTREISKFQIKAKEIVTNIAKLHEFLMENRKAYLDTSVLMFNQVPRLSQVERVEFDSTTHLIIQNCKQQLKELNKENLSNTNINHETKTHREKVIDIINQYFTAVNKTYQDLKEQYNKRHQELQKVTKLEGDTMQNFRKTSFGQENPAWDTATDSPRIYSAYNEDYHQADEDRLNFNAAEIQLFEKENTLLFNELNSLSEEVNQIQGSVEQIAELQQTLTEKVLDQYQDTERISAATVTSTENIREGNEQLRQALQGSSGFRLWIIFFLLVLLFALLFLDWYND